MANRDEEKAKRLANALRDNLRKRKAKAVAATMRSSAPSTDQTQLVEKP
jgi:hypothetical protein